MRKVLVTYTTEHGSTTEVAQAIAAELQGSNVEVYLRTLEKVDGLASHDAVIVGVPMIHGWHHDARKFLAHNQHALNGKPLALFHMVKAVTQSSAATVAGARLFQGPKLVRPAKNPAKLG